MNCGFIVYPSQKTLIPTCKKFLLHPIMNSVVAFCSIKTTPQTP